MLDDQEAGAQLLPDPAQHRAEGLRLALGDAARRLVEPGRLTSHLLIASAAVLVIVELATQLQISVSDKANTALWVVQEAPADAWKSKAPVRFEPDSSR